MPLLLLAVPLRKSWLGFHYWKAPSIMDLPVELEYIPYHEFEDRFVQLNKIVKPIYPTIWPNIIVATVVITLFSAAVVGISLSSSSTSIMGQLACFVLPIFAVLWIRIRKETKTRARKKFKHKSQKLLRSWTSQDLATHAIQWKLRVRPKSLVMRQRRTLAPRVDPNMTEQEETRPQEQQQGQQHNTPVTIRIEQHQDVDGAESINEDNNNNDNNDNNILESQMGDQTQLSTRVQALTPVPTIAFPRQVADVYSVLRNPTRTMAEASSSQAQGGQQQQEQQQQQQQRERSTTNPTRQERVARENSELTLWKEILCELSCISYFNKEPKIWVIEISIREGLLDEYAVLVPSPAYCDYRLPGYEDIITGGGRARTPLSVPLSTSGGAAIGADASVQPRYSGLPPAYESDSENESDDDEDEDDTSVRGDDDSRVLGTLSENAMEMAVVSVSSTPAALHRRGSTGMMDMMSPSSSQYVVSNANRSSLTTRASKEEGVASGTED
ncbi:hypothetical protein BGZ46_009398 [Entomortierella lignicola]|nr:hypothetical protein BGZ46_009398 [Entomortierella lignicola]